MTLKLLDERSRRELCRVRAKRCSRGFDEFLRRCSRRETGRDNPFHPELVGNHQIGGVRRQPNADDAAQRFVIRLRADKVKPSRKLRIPRQRLEQVLDPWPQLRAEVYSQNPGIAGGNVQRLMQRREIRERPLVRRRFCLARVQRQPALEIVDEIGGLEVDRQRREVLARWRDDPVLNVPHQHGAVLDFERSILSGFATVQTHAHQALQDLFYA